MTHPFKKVFLIILDGLGLAQTDAGNAVAQANMPFVNTLLRQYQAFNIVASGLVVGLPWGKPGNSEVGHSAIGTGRIVIQDWARINAEIQNGDFFKNQAFLDAINHCKKNKSKLHIVGCASPGGIHAHEDHLIALMVLAEREQFHSVYIHMITDGEDSGNKESLETLGRLSRVLKDSGAKIATVIGRVYGMDRVFNWELTQKTWKAMVDGVGEQIDDVSSYLALSHSNDIFDDQIIPAVVLENGKPIATVDDHDAIICFNYRNDRAKQLIMPFVTSDFNGFAREKIPQDLFVVSMTRYSNDLGVNAIAYEAADIHHTLGKEISRRNLRQFRVAEKEKEAHVTNFFNGGRIDPYEGTEQVIVSSLQLRASSYPKHPEMSANQITAELIARKDQDFTLYLANYANSDMMAHTGNLEATIKGLQCIDESLQKVVTAALQDPETAVVLTCDHGNSEEMIDPSSGGADTQHSANNVFAIFAGDGLTTDIPDRTLETLANEPSGGSLIDIAPTVLHLLNFEKPVEMTGTELV